MAGLHGVTTFSKRSTNCWSSVGTVGISITAGSRPTVTGGESGRRRGHEELTGHDALQGEPRPKALNGLLQPTAAS